MENIISVDSLTVQAGRKQLLADVDFTIEPGDFVTILGENGCGKSTLLSTLLALHANYQGNIHLLEKPLADYPVKELALIRAYVSQFNQVNFAYLVEDILLLARHFASEALATSVEIIETVVAMLDIGHLLGRKVTELSGGERQRVFIAKAIIQLWQTGQPAQNQRFDGKLLFLDEPTSALDIRHQKQLLDTLAILKMQGLTIVCVSHDINLFSRLSDQILILANKSVLAAGSPHQVLTVANIEAGFGYCPKLIQDEHGHPYLMQ